MGKGVDLSATKARTSHDQTLPCLLLSLDWPLLNCITLLMITISNKVLVLPYSDDEK